MITDQPIQGNSPPSPSPRPSDGLIGVSLLLSAVATWLVLWGFWLEQATYQHYRGRTDLDMPDWFAINMDLTSKVLPLAAAAGLIDLISGVFFLAWVHRAGWMVRIGFAVQWLASVVLVGWLVWSRLP